MKLLIVCKIDIYMDIHVEVIILGKYDKKALINLDQELYDLVKQRSSELHISISSYIRLCIIKETTSKKGGKIL